MSELSGPSAWVLLALEGVDPPVDSSASVLFFAGGVFAGAGFDGVVAEGALFADGLETNGVESPALRGAVRSVEADWED